MPDAIGAAPHSTVPTDELAAIWQTQRQSLLAKLDALDSLRHQLLTTHRDEITAARCESLNLVDEKAGQLRDLVMRSLAAPLIEEVADYFCRYCGRKQHECSADPCLNVVWQLGKEVPSSGWACRQRLLQVTAAAQKAFWYNLRQLVRAYHSDFDIDPFSDLAGLDMPTLEREFRKWQQKQNLNKGGEW